MLGQARVPDDACHVLILTSQPTHTRIIMMSCLPPDLKALAPLVPLVVAVTGRVWTARPLSCELSETAAAIVELQEERKGERRAGAVWVRQSEPVRTSVREAEWCLQEASGEPGRQNEPMQLPVLAGSSAHGDYLQSSGDVFVPAQGGGVMDALVGELAGHRHLGQRIRERALPVGTAITAVGELADVLDHPAAFEVPNGLGFECVTVSWWGRVI